jgi:hypothetical protein
MKKNSINLMNHKEVMLDFEEIMNNEDTFNISFDPKSFRESFMNDYIEVMESLLFELQCRQKEYNANVKNV